MILRVNSIYNTIQGEGAHAGIPVVLLRLQGCSVQCPWCSYRDTWPLHAGVGLEPEAIVDIIDGIAGGQKWVFLTGGEPLDQDVYPLVDLLHEADYLVHLETSGVEVPEMHKFDWITVGWVPGTKQESLALASEVKFLIRCKADLPSLDMLDSFHSAQSVVIKPAPSYRVMQMCIDYVEEHNLRLAAGLQLYIYNKAREEANV